MDKKPEPPTREQIEAHNRDLAEEQELFRLAGQPSKRWQWWWWIKTHVFGVWRKK